MSHLYVRRHRKDVGIKEELESRCLFSEFEKSWILEQIEDD